MTGPVTPAAIASLCRARTTTLQEAADLIQAYADQFASGEVIKALEESHARMMVALESPVGLS